MAFEAHAGARLGDYEILTELGRGGMGQVFLGRDVRLGRSVALKVLSPQLAGDDDYRARFLREARIAANLEHPNVIPVYDVGEFEGCLFLAMRYVSGADLCKLLTSGPLDPERSLGILAQMASALDAAHLAGLVHRDVKPGNILLVEPSTPGGIDHAYLADFGIAWQQSFSDVHTQPGNILATVAYAPPEQLEGRPVDGRADVYALGAVLFETLIGTTPFARTMPVVMMAAQLYDPPPRPSELRGDLPPALDAVVAQALAKSREDRFPTCSRLIEAARAAFDGVGAPTEFVPHAIGALPVPLSSFVGREPDMESVLRALEAARLVTLVGAGGSGKSRLGIEVARVVERGGTPVVYLDLADSDVKRELAQPIRDALDARSNALGSDRTILLVLNDCDHHVDGVRACTGALLTQRPELSVLATCRERLAAPGERVVLVEPLAVPAPGSESDVLATPAGKLFWDRATAVDPGLTPSPPVLSAVGRMVQALDGLPLGIELAASQVRGLPLEEIADRVLNHPALLVDPNVEGRHRTILDAIEWSFDLLTPQERLLFVRLGVFTGSFSSDDVRTVCGDGIDTGSVSDALAHLVERSLVVMRREALTSYRLLGSIARFARARLVVTGEADQVRIRHAERFLGPLAADDATGPRSTERGATEAAAALRWVSMHMVGGPIRELAGIAAVAMGDWWTAVALLEPAADRVDPRALEALGVALCKAHPGATSPEFRRGQQLLADSHERAPNPRSLAALAGTYKGVDDARAHALYAAATELAPYNSYALGNLLEYEIEESQSLDCLEARSAQIDVALARCQRDAADGRNIPWARFDAGKLLALRGRTDDALNSYLLGLTAGTSDHPIEASLRSLQKLAAVAGTPDAVELAARLLHLTLAARAAGSVQGSRGEPASRLAPPVLVLAGDAGTQFESVTSARGDAVRAALRGFVGTLVAGGTPVGVSGLVGELTVEHPALSSVGYVPARLPPEAEIDPRYTAIRHSDGTDFGPAEPLAYWADILAAGIRPERVAVIGIGGGDIAAFEYRLALVLGATVGLLRESGRAATALLSDPEWSSAPRLFEVPADAGIRDFLQRAGTLSS